MGDLEQEATLVLLQRVDLGYGAVGAQLSLCSTPDLTGHKDAMPEVTVMGPFGLGLSVASWRG